MWLDVAARLEAGDGNKAVAAALRVSERSVERWRRQRRGGGGGAADQR
ncbi:helix-turn-helix domain-containing protein [Streptomyces sp. NBC_00631]